MVGYLSQHFKIPNPLDYGWKTVKVKLGTILIEGPTPAPMEDVNVEISPTRKNSEL